MDDENIDDFVILEHLRKNAKNDKIADFVIRVFMSELSNEPWPDKCESMLDDYIEDDLNEDWSD